ncbi:putative CheA signal transduction histidine kinase [Thioalkalivibrio sulfidiphilus HL-EbGr7]|uniref:Chemotaxis protein CheA n=2 Tax=Thioalkalivibrio TaxID=106633 RepID=B8GP53_THISH|nr:Hpt domain-containing protein [Thioalkalivibrio sulfidiphilus]ACL73973.1 putative CheA signal transduction histidine kinase [Thioalkalivibrio sulfidiphilus HL-EbGr7]
MTDETIEYSALHWVKKELDALLNEARVALESYIEDDAQTDKLADTESKLRQVNGTLQMVELHGAALLAEEMVRLTQAVRDGSVTSRDDAFEVLMRAILQLPDYLEHIQTGHRDIPIVLLPLLNDLRTTRNASLMSENVLFFPDMEGIMDRDEGETEVRPSGEDIRELARRSRHHYQLGLLGLFRNRDVPQSLQRIQSVIADLRRAARDDAVRRLFWVGGAVAEALGSGALEPSVTVKQLLGRIDREMRVLIQDGESALGARIPGDLIKNLLYYVARSRPGGEQVGAVKRAFRLNELLPEGADLEEALANIRGPNQELMDTVSRAIREDLAEVKDGLDVFMHSAQARVEDLKPQVEKLHRMADTMAMLGMAEPREMALREADTIDALIAAGDEAKDDTLLMDVASRLLNMEAAVNGLVASRGRAGARAGLLPDALGELSAAESRTIINSMLREALADMTRAKSGILDFVAEPAKVEHLSEVPATLQRVGGALSILSLEGVEEVLRGIRDYVQAGVLATGKVPPAEQQEALAEAITAVELYLETLDSGNGDPRPMLETARTCVARLSTPELPAALSADETLIVTPEHGLSMPAADEDATWMTSRPAPAADMPEPEATVAEVPESVEVAQPSEEIAAAPAAEPEPEPQRFPVLSGEVDEEIKEIFLEETTEEIERISEYLPRWRENPADQEALTTVRRSYHTLKGSGRLVGALLLGEFAWSMENLLNRIIDQSVSPGPAVYAVLGEALRMLPVLRGQIEGGEGDEPGTYALMARAHALARGETAPARAAPPALAPVEPPVSAALAEAPEASEPEISGEVVPTVILDREDLDFSSPDVQAPVTAETGPQADDTLTGLAVEGGFDLALEPGTDEDTLAQGETGLSLEDLDVGAAAEELNALEPLEGEFGSLETPPEESTLTFETEALEAPEAGTPRPEADTVISAPAGLSDHHEAETRFMARAEIPGMEPTPAEAVPPVAQRMDPALFEIFRNEATQHLNTLRSQLEGASREDGGMPVTDALLRAVHTLNGAARTAEVPEIFEVCAPCERYVKARADTEAFVPGAALPGFWSLIEHVSGVIEALGRGEDPLPSGERLAEDMQAMLDEELARQERVRQEEARQSAAALAAAAAAAVPAQPAPTEAVTYDEQDQELVDIFLEEGGEILDASDNLLESWRHNLNDQGIIAEIQRQLHTLKGGARMAGLRPIGDLSHALETLVIDITEGRGQAQPAMLDVVAQSLDTLSRQLEQARRRESLITAPDLIARLSGFKAGEAEAPAERAAPSVPETVSITEEIPAQSPVEDEIVIEEIPVDEASPRLSVDELPDETLELVEEPGYGGGEPTLTEIPEVSAAAPAEEPARAGARAAADSGPQELVRVRSEVLDNLVNYAGEVNIYHARLEQQITGFRFNLGELSQTVTRLREQLRKLEMETEAQILFRYEQEKQDHEIDADFDPLEMDRYSNIQQLSRALAESINDLVSIQDILSDQVRDSETLLLQQSRVSTDLQEGLMRTRMVQFSNMVPRLRRVVRQTATELGKRVELDIQGEGSELDRSVLERMVSPLEHMLRNAVYHGIESADKRRATGKADAGHIDIQVTREGSEVVIRVSDDGGGINLDAVRSKAMRLGLIKGDEALTDEDIMQFILESGFSTAQEVSQISGRGVGMDVVNSEIKQLGGTLGIETVPGKGTRFTVRLPFTLAINQALLVQVGEDIYAVPLSSIEGIVRARAGDLARYYEEANPTYDYAGNTYEVKHLGALLEVSQPNLHASDVMYPVLLVRSGDHRIALHVDGLLGSREVVIKSVGPQVAKVRGISGATILGDGRVVLILDVPALVRIGAGVQLVYRAPEGEAAEAEEHIPTVMVVDDSITIRKVTARMLERNHYRVITAKDGLDAVAQLQEHVPDVMLLDIEMPRMDGYELATHIRNDSRLREIPIIMITSRTGEKHRQRALDIGVNRYLGKPYQEADLLANIQDILAQ